MFPSKRLVSIVCCLSIGVAVLAIAAPDANGQCSRRGGCSTIVADGPVYTAAPAAAKYVGDACVVPSTAVPQGGCEASVLGGPVLVEGRPLANIGRRFLYRLRHPFAPMLRRGG